MEPGSVLAIVSLALQVTHGLLSYYELWKDGDEKVAEIQRWLMWFSTVFTQLDSTLSKPSLNPEVVLVLQNAISGCKDQVEKLQRILEKLQKEGTPQGVRSKLKKINRRLLYIYHRGEVEELRILLISLREDLQLSLNLLTLNSSATSLNDIQAIQDILGALKADIDKREKIIASSNKEETENRSRAAVMQWLRSCNISEAHFSAYKKHESGTGEWFLNGRPYNKWLSMEHSNLWIIGNVGCGKTVLCAHILEALKARLNRTDVGHDSLIYFYFAFNDVQRQDSSAFLRSALAQLCHIEPIASLVTAMHRALGPDPPSLRALHDGFFKILNILCSDEEDVSINGGFTEDWKPGKTYIVLDGLDEVPYGLERTLILNLLATLSQCHYKRLHILVSSRHERDIEAHLLHPGVNWDYFRIGQPQIEADLDIYIQSQIHRNPKLNSQPKHVKDEITNKLVHGASGMFQWAALQMQGLSTRRILRSKDILLALSVLPKDLNATYERILDGIDPSLSEEASAALQWLSCSNRPLFIEELAEASIIQPDIHYSFEEERRFNTLDILEVLPGLIKVDPPPDLSGPFRHRIHRVSLAHFSLKEYLLKSAKMHNSPCSYVIDSGLAHRHIARSCLVYMQYCIQKTTSATLTAAECPLGIYAHEKWQSHADSMTQSFGEEFRCEILDLLGLPQSCLRWDENATWFRHMSGRSRNDTVRIPFDAFKSPQWPQYYLLLYAVQSGDEATVGQLLSDGLDITPEAIVGHPLGLALNLKKYALAELLLMHGAQADKIEFLTAMRHSSDKVAALVLQRPPVLGMSDILRAILYAIAAGSYERADKITSDILFPGTFSLRSKRSFHRLKDMSVPDICMLVLQKAVHFNSSRLLEYLVKRIPKTVFKTLSMDQLFLRALVQGNSRIAHAIRSLPEVQISQSVLKFESKWRTTMESVSERACRAVLNACTVLLDTKMPLRQSTDSLSTDVTFSQMLRPLFSRSSIISLEKQWMTLQNILGVFSVANAHSHRSLWGWSTGLMYPMSLRQRLLLCQVLSSSYMDRIWIMYSSCVPTPERQLTLQIDFFWRDSRTERYNLGHGSEPNHWAKSLEKFLKHSSSSAKDTPWLPSLLAYSAEYTGLTLDDVHGADHTDGREQHGDGFKVQPIYAPGVLKVSRDRKGSSSTGRSSYYVIDRSLFLSLSPKPPGSSPCQHWQCEGRQRRSYWSFEGLRIYKKVLNIDITFHDSIQDGWYWLDTLQHIFASEKCGLSFLSKSFHVTPKSISLILCDQDFEEKNDSTNIQAANANLELERTWLGAYEDPVDRGVMKWCMRFLSAISKTQEKGWSIDMSCEPVPTINDQNDNTTVKDLKNLNEPGTLMKQHMNMIGFQSPADLYNDEADGMKLQMVISGGPFIETID